LATLAVVTFTAATFDGKPTRPRRLSASDNACNSPRVWSNNQEHGTGFGAWSLFS